LKTKQPRTLSATSMGVALAYFIYRVTPHRTTQKALDRIKLLMPLDAIIVPGVPFDGVRWHSVMQARVMWSVILYRNGYTRNIIYSGGAVYSPYKEAVIMGLYAQKLGVPPEHIMYETCARHSTENIALSYLQAKKEGFKTIAVATDVFQSTMLRPFTSSRFGSTVHHLPFTQDAVAAYTHIYPHIDPSPAFTPGFVSIVSKESLWQRIKGTLGNDMNFKQYDNGKLPPL
jgi:hypothetical protein